MKTLFVEDRNLAVVELQARLRKLYASTGLVDGHYGIITETVVKQFQKENRLLVDGIVGKRTWAELINKTKNDLLFLFLHCSATAKGQDLPAEWIVELHTKQKGWSRPGYSDVIELDGSLKNIYPWDINDDVDLWEFTWGTKKLNKNSRHICYIGGVDANDINKAKDTRTEKQLETMELYIKFMLKMYPELIVVGHNQVQRKACPSFDVPTYLESIGIKKNNIGHWKSLYK